MASSLTYALHHYGQEHELQRLGVWDVDSADRDKCWIIYIHGGAWRDPRITHEAFVPSITHMLSAPVQDRIAAFASIDYRLSPHPNFPQDRASTPPSEYRGARHPDHVNDVRAAISFLQKQYGFGSNYILIGHSAGASLAFQLLLLPGSSSNAVASGSISGTDDVRLTLPQAVIGFEGLYDFCGINARFNYTYSSFFSAAFGPDQKDWEAAAPVSLAGDYGDAWLRSSDGRKKLVLLGQSKEDTLVDEPEVDAMAKRLKQDGFTEEEGGLVVLKDLKGDHDDIWKGGEGVARMVRMVLEKIQ